MVEESLSMIRNVSVPYIEAEDCKDVNLHAFKIVNTKAMFVSRKVVSRKPLSKLPHVCLFRKVGQRKTLSGQRKIWLDFHKSVFLFGYVCFPESGFRKITFQTFLCLFAVRKVGQRKTLSSQRKI
jgi:hypothetical protein